MATSELNPGHPFQWPETSCDCPDCRAACLNSPGWFLPRQLPALARLLDLPLSEVFHRYLALGVTAMPDGTLRRGVMPHKLRDRKKPGALWSLAELARPGRCVFYDRGRCAIYPVRPFECSRMMHGRPPALVRRLRRAIVRLWTPAALAPLLALAGRPAGRTGAAPDRGGRPPGRRARPGRPAAPASPSRKKPK